jgi:hypothetical protein
MTVIQKQQKDRRSSKSPISTRWGVRFKMWRMSNSPPRSSIQPKDWHLSGSQHYPYPTKDEADAPTSSDFPCPAQLP